MKTQAQTPESTNGKARPAQPEHPAPPKVSVEETIEHNRIEIERLTRELATRLLKPRGFLGIRTSV